MALPALCNFGSDELKRQFLAPSISGDFIGKLRSLLELNEFHYTKQQKLIQIKSTACVGVTEASGGSDVASIKTTAKQKGDDLIINGEKCWISNGMQADWMCLLANTSDDTSKPHKNKSLICVPLDQKGVEY